MSDPTFVSFTVSDGKSPPGKKKETLVYWCKPNITLSCNGGKDWVGGGINGYLLHIDLHPASTENPHSLIDDYRVDIGRYHELCGQNKVRSK